MKKSFPLAALLLLFLFPGSALASYADINGAKNKRFYLKTSQGALTGTLSLPKGVRKPRTIVYLHPTLGLGDKCAPSRLESFPDDGFRSFLAEMTNRGYAVLQPDYLGIGSPGIHPFLRNAREGRATVESFSVLRKKYKLSNRYFLLGYSQGAGVAFEGARASYMSANNLVGTGMLAPPVYLETAVKSAPFIEERSVASALLLYLLRANGDRSLLSPEALPLWDEAGSNCLVLFASESVGFLSPSEVLASTDWQSPRLERLLRYAASATPRGAVAGRLALFYGGQDGVMPRPLEEDLLQELKKSNPQLQSYFYPTSTHSALPSSSYQDLLRFIESSFAGPGSRFLEL